MPTQENRKRKEELFCKQTPAESRLCNICLNITIGCYIYILSAALLFRGRSSRFELADLYTGCSSGHNPPEDSFLQKGDLLHVGRMC